MLLLITGSADGTADRLVDRIGEGVFRLNYDLWSDYDFFIQESGWEIRNPAGLKITSETVTCAYWWKAFSYFVDNQDKFVVAEVKYIFRELYGWCVTRGLTKGNSIDFHNTYGKMNIQSLARHHFKTSPALVTFNLYGSDLLKDAEVVTKSLASVPMNDKSVLHTTPVKLDALHPKYPWFLQKKIDSAWDVTVFYCNGKTFGFRRSREDLEGLDWRAEQDFHYTEQEWFPIDLDREFTSGINSLSDDLNVEFGRYDFMINEHNEMIFLEFNANGQWVFLDIKDEYGLLDCVASWLSPQD